MKLYRAVQDGRVVHLSPEPLGTEDFPGDVSLEEVEQEVPTVDGVVKLWGGDDGESYPHLHYVCPRCATEQNVDLNSGDASPRFACCDTCGWDSVAWIRWSA